MTDNLITSGQAGRILGKSARTVQRMVDSGQLTAAQKLPGPNGAFLFRESDVRTHTKTEDDDDFDATMPTA